MSRTLGAKIDARLLLLEEKLAVLQRELDNAHGALLEEIVTTDTNVDILRNRVAALEAKRGPGRPKNE